jgi:hypothetical protein
MKIRIPIFTREPISGHITFLSKDSRRPAGLRLGAVVDSQDRHHPARVRTVA